MLTNAFSHSKTQENSMSFECNHVFISLPYLHVRFVLESNEIQEMWTTAHIFPVPIHRRLSGL